MDKLLPAWPLIVGIIVLVAAFVGWVCCAISAPHRPTRMIGILWCEDCQVTCYEGYPCWCCRMEAERVFLKEQT